MKTRQVIDHAILLAGAALMLLPVFALFFSSTHSNLTINRHGLQMTPGGEFLSVYGRTLSADGLFGQDITAARMMLNSFVVAIGFAVIKCAASLMAAFALVYFRIRFASLLFGLILITLFFPIETRILPTFLVTHQVGLLNTYAGLILPLTATGLGTLFFRQFLKQLPDELLEAARLDGAGPLRFLVDILLPLAWPAMTALFALLFVVGWNQYLWPLMVATGNDGLFTLVRGIERAGRGGNAGMALAILAILPPGLLVLILQRSIMRGLIGVSR